MNVPKSKTKATLTFILVCFLLGPMPSFAHAAAIDTEEPPPKGEKNPPPSASSVAEEPDECLSDLRCKDTYDTARAQSEAGQHDAALINYQNAYARKPVPWLLISIGRMHHKLSRFQPAIANYKKYLALPSEVSDEVLRQKARTYLKQAQEQLAEQERRFGPSPSDVKSVPVYKKWWFWTAVGAAAAAVAVGVGVGVSSRDPDTTGLVTYTPFGM